MKVSAVVPTIDGRESLLEQTIQSLSDTADGHSIELIVVRNAPTVGEAWNEGAEEATGTHLWLGADDVTLALGWLDAVGALADQGEYPVYPCPRIIRPDGSVEACGTLGQGALIEGEVENGTSCNSSPFPFMRREVWDEIGPSLPIHYYADDYLAFKARTAYLDIRLSRDYTITHYEGTAGRQRMVMRCQSDRDTFLKTIAKERSCLGVLT